MSGNMRPVIESDFPIIRTNLLKIQEKNPARQMVQATIEPAMAYVEQAVKENRCYIVDDTFFVMFDVGSLWFSNEKFLLEQLVMRISPNNFHVGNAVQALTELAKFHGATRIVSGDTQLGLMTKHYLADGYEPLGTQLIKEI